MRNNGDFDHAQDEPQLKSNVENQMKYAQFKNCMGENKKIELDEKKIQHLLLDFGEK